MVTFGLLSGWKEMFLFNEKSIHVEPNVEINKWKRSIQSKSLHYYFLQLFIHVLKLTRKYKRSESWITMYHKQNDIYYNLWHIQTCFPLSNRIQELTTIHRKGDTSSLTDDFSRLAVDVQRPLCYQDIIPKQFNFDSFFFVYFIIFIGWHGKNTKK